MLLLLYDSGSYCCAAFTENEVLCVSTLLWLMKTSNKGNNGVSPACKRRLYTKDSLRERNTHTHTQTGEWSALAILPPKWWLTLIDCHLLRSRWLGWPWELEEGKDLLSLAQVWPFKTSDFAFALKVQTNNMDIIWA